MLVLSPWCHVLPRWRFFAQYLSKACQMWSVMQHWAAAPLTLINSENVIEKRKMRRSINPNGNRARRQRRRRDSQKAQYRAKES